VPVRKKEKCRYVAMYDLKKVTATV
jgi:hypothetical protein